MWGRKAKRILELEAAVAELTHDAMYLRRKAESHVRLSRQDRLVIVQQRRALKDLDRAIKANRLVSKDAANKARVVIAGLGHSFPGATRHDGNHPVGECDACDAFRALEEFASKPWHHVIRALGSRRVGAQ